MLLAAEEKEADEEATQQRDQRPEPLLEGEEGAGAAVVGAVADGAIEGLVQFADEGVARGWAAEWVLGKLRVHGAYSRSGLREQTPARVGPSCTFRTRILPIMAQQASPVREPASAGATDLALQQALPALPILERERLHPFEIKWDGIRALAAVEATGWRLWGRQRADYTARYPELDGLRGLPAGTLVDGELVACAPEGRPELPRLLRRHGLTDAWRIRQARRWCPVQYLLFRSCSAGGQDGEAAGSRFLRASSRSIEKGPAPARISASRPAI
jgi:hypothetical protein